MKHKPNSPSSLINYLISLLWPMMVHMVGKRAGFQCLLFYINILLSSLHLYWGLAYIQRMRHNAGKVPALKYITIRQKTKWKEIPTSLFYRKRSEMQRLHYLNQELNSSLASLSQGCSSSVLLFLFNNDNKQSKKYQQGL